jgi:glycerol-3-phosphate dehydrogenase subunit B
MRRHDAIVVGAGLAGLSAAVRLAEGGASVLVLARGIGATHLSPCTIDVLGYDPDPVRSPREALRRLAADRPGHPYRLVGADGVEAAVGWLGTQLADGPLAPYRFVGGLDENLRLPTAIGVPRPSAVVPETMAPGDVGSDDAPVCVVGFSALKDFHPLLLADNLSRAGIEARGVELTLVPEGRHDVNALGYARAFDDFAFRSRVINALAGRLAPGERVAFPAVLGIRDPHGVWTDIADRLGHQVFEVPTLPPSVPGMRLFATLRERLRRAGGRMILNAVVTGGERRGDRLVALRVRTGLREAVHPVDWVVLATGGFASGGLELDSTWRARETALGLPVAGVPPPGEPRFLPGYFDEHPIAAAGVAVDDGQRPVGPDGGRVLSNVVVAGATLAGAQPWREKSGDGLSLSTGHRAAELILAEARGAPAAGTTAGRA